MSLLFSVPLFDVLYTICAIRQAEHFYQTESSLPQNGAVSLYKALYVDIIGLPQPLIDLVSNRRIRQVFKIKQLD